MNVAKFFQNNIGLSKFDEKHIGKFYVLNNTFCHVATTEKFPFSEGRDVAFVFVIGPDCKLWQIPPAWFDTMREFRDER